MFRAVLKWIILPKKIPRDFAANMAKIHQKDLIYIIVRLVSSNKSGCVRFPENKIAILAKFCVLNFWRESLYVCRYIKFLWVLKFGQVGVWGTLISNSTNVRRFMFFVQNFIFLGAGCFFWYILCYFFLKWDFAYKLKGVSL